MLQLRFMPGWVPRNGFFGLKETIGTVHKRFYALASEQPSRKTVKPLDSRKTFLIDTYKHLMENSSMIFFVHYNNLSKTEDHHFRFKIKQTEETHKSKKQPVRSLLEKFASARPMWIREA